MEWQYISLDKLCDVINGLWTGKKEPFVNIAVIRNTNFSKDCKLKIDNIAYIDVEAKQLETRKLQYGDIIIEKSGGSEKQPVGRAVLFDITNGDFSFSNFTTTLRIKDSNKILPQFLHKCLYAYYCKGETLKMQSKTTGLHNLNMKTYLRLCIPVPSIAEQERIVGELDLLSGIIDKQRAQLKELDTLAQSIFYDMFGDPITNEKGWVINQLGDICDTGSGGTPSKKVKEYWEGGCIPWIGSHMCQNKIIYETDGKFITQMGLDNSSAKMLPVDTIIIALVGATIGKVGLLKIECCTNQNIAFAKISSKINCYFLYYVIIYLYKLFLNIGKGKFKMANLAFVRNLPIIQPPLTLQQQFAERAENIEKQKELIKQSISETEMLFNSRMDYYFD